MQWLKKKCSVNTFHVNIGNTNPVMKQSQSFNPRPGESRRALSGNCRRRRHGRHRELDENSCLRPKPAPSPGEYRGE
jgi:hypothetical protein